MTLRARCLGHLFAFCSWEKEIFISVIFVEKNGMLFRKIWSGFGKMDSMILAESSDFGKIKWFRQNQVISEESDNFGKIR